jgi:hypothetical protein
MLTQTPFDLSGACDVDGLSSFAGRDEPRLTTPEIATLISAAGAAVSVEKENSRKRSWRDAR